MAPLPENHQKLLNIICTSEIRNRPKILCKCSRMMLFYYTGLQECRATKVPGLLRYPGLRCKGLCTSSMYLKGKSKQWALLSQSPKRLHVFSIFHKSFFSEADNDFERHFVLITPDDLKFLGTFTLFLPFSIYKACMFCFYVRTNSV